MVSCYDNVLVDYKLWIFAAPGRFSGSRRFEWHPLGLSVRGGVVVVIVVRSRGKG